MPILRTLAITFCCLLFTVSVVAAQVADCAAQVTSVIERAGEACSDLDLNQACYGTRPVSIQPLPNVRLDFGEPGDKVDVALLESIDLDVIATSFGIASMRFRTAGLDQSVHLVAFGDVTVTNENLNPSDYLIFPVTVSDNQGANVRLLPSADAEIVSQLITGQTVDADGRTEDGAWLRLFTGGWVSADVLSSDYDLSQLSIFLPESHPLVQHVDIIAGRTMQSFRVDSVPHGFDCAAVPDSGVLVQTADGTDQAYLEVTGLDMVFSGTILVQGKFKEETTITVLEGQMSAEDLTISVGEQLIFSFDLDNTFYSEIVPDYDYVRATYLPLSLLPRHIDLPFSLGGLIFPFTPGTGFLETIPADGACTVVWAGDVNLRSGPGTNYPIRQGVPGGFYAEPDARAIGTDGRVWWRLADKIWIAADTTVGGGACAALPLVDPPPLSESTPIA